jgi:hypothetical protein
MIRIKQLRHSFILQIQKHRRPINLNNKINFNLGMNKNDLLIYNINLETWGE